MTKDFFPLKLLLRPSECFSGLAAGRAGWGWPLGLYAAAAAASALLITSLSPDFLARASSDLPAAADSSFASALAVGLPGGLAFNAFFCALAVGFAVFVGTGRLMFRLPLPFAAVAGYAFFFILRLDERAGGAAGWAAAGAALAFAAWAAWRSRAVFAALLKLILALSIFALCSDLACAAAALADAPRAYKASEFFFAFLSLGWLVRGTASAAGIPAARAFAAVLPALLGAAAFAFSLHTLGLLSAKVFEMLLLI